MITLNYIAVKGVGPRLRMITEGGKKNQKINYVIFKRPLTKLGQGSFKY